MTNVDAINNWGTVLLFGPGYCGKRIAAALTLNSIKISTIGRDDHLRAEAEVAHAGVIISTVPPEDGGDPVLAHHGRAIAAARTQTGVRLIYLSSTGVYGDTGGAWVDESATLAGRRPDRIAADRAWAGLGAVVLRLPGIYGPGRSVVERLRGGQAHRIDDPAQVFSRIHVDDVAGAVLAALRADAPGIYNIADDRPCAQAELVDWTAQRLGLPSPPLLPLAEAGLSAAARAFYAENRRVANGKARRLLGWRPLYPDYRTGLADIVADARRSLRAP